MSTYLIVYINVVQFYKTLRLKNNTFLEIDKNKLQYSRGLAKPPEIFLTPV